MLIPYTIYSRYTVYYKLSAARTTFWTKLGKNYLGASDSTWWKPPLLSRSSPSIYYMRYIPCTTHYIYIYILCVQYTLHYELRATRWKCLTKFGLKNRGESGSFLKTSIVVNIGLNTLLYYSVYYLLYVYCILQAARSGQKIVDQISFQNGASDFTHWQPPLWRSPQLYCVIYFRHCIIHILLFIHLCINLLWIYTCKGCPRDSVAFYFSSAVYACENTKKINCPPSSFWWFLNTMFPSAVYVFLLFYFSNFM